MVVRQVDRGLGDEGKGVAVDSHPGDQGRQDILFQHGLVADEVVVDHEDRAPPAGVVDGFDLLDELPGALQARHASVERGDVTELAVEGTAPGELDAHAGVVLGVEQFPGGRRGVIQRRTVAGVVDMSGQTLL